MTYDIIYNSRNYKGIIAPLNRILGGYDIYNSRNYKGIIAKILSTTRGLTDLQ